MAVASAGLYANNLHLAPWHITTPTPHHSDFTGRMLFLTPNQQGQSTQDNWHLCSCYLFCKYCCSCLAEQCWLPIRQSPSVMAEDTLQAAEAPAYNTSQSWLIDLAKSRVAKWSYFKKPDRTPRCRMCWWGGKWGESIPICSRLAGPEECCSSLTGGWKQKRFRCILYPKGTFGE